MRIGVVGASGGAGAAIVGSLRSRGERPVSIGRGSGSDEDGEHRRADLADGESLSRALAGLDVVVHAANGRSDAEAVLVAGTRRLIAAAADAGVGHLVSISIVGCEQVPIAYYRVKSEQDRIVAASPVPWTIVPATQFHSLIAGLFGATRRAGLLLGGPAPLRPVAAERLGEAVAEAALGAPRGRTAQVVGPRTERLGELARAYRRATGSRRLVVPAPLVGGLRRGVMSGALAGGGPDGGGPGFEEWLLARGEGGAP